MHGCGARTIPAPEGSTISGRTRYDCGGRPRCVVSRQGHQHSGKPLEVTLVRTSVRTAWLSSSVILVLALPAGAQDKPREDKQAAIMPSSAMPPAGLCRVWLRDVPPTQQPAPTDCASAVRRAPATATVVFGATRNATVAPERSRSVTSQPGSVRAIVPGGGGHTAALRAPATTARPPSAPPAVKPPEKPQS